METKIKSFGRRSLVALALALPLLAGCKSTYGLGTEDYTDNRAKTETAATDSDVYKHVSVSELCSGPMNYDSSLIQIEGVPSEPQMTKYEHGMGSELFFGIKSDCNDNVIPSGNLESSKEWVECLDSFSVIGQGGRNNISVDGEANAVLKGAMSVDSKVKVYGKFEAKDNRLLVRRIVGMGHDLQFYYNK